MNSFWRLVGYEYKKVFYKRSILMLLVLSVVVTAASVWGILLGSTYVDGELFESHYDGMVKDRAYARSLAGRQINAELIMEAAQAYARLPKKDRYMDTLEYQTLARPYSEIYNISRTVYNTSSRRFNMEDFQALTTEQADQFYTLRRDKQVQAVEETEMSNKAKEKVLALDRQIHTPFIFSYTDGYTRFFTLMYPMGMMAAFVMAICIAPLFSGEYTSGADQLILAARHGKHRLIQSKLFAGFSIAAAIALVLMAVSFILSMLTFGFDGASAPLQLYYPMSPYPLTMAQTALLLAICTFFACLLTAAITMLLSAKFKSSFGVIIVTSLLLIVPMFITVSYDHVVLYNLFHLLPSNMMEFGSITSPIQYELFALTLSPFVLLPLFASATSILLVPFAYRSFKNHQIA
jgi:ABC-type transport system involved in multi-copper enzyme maturation permease subunit